MFEVYRDKSYDRDFHVVYYTELDDHNKESEINRALAGEHFVDGYLRNFGKDEAKRIIDGLLADMNNGELLTADEFRARI